MALLIRILASKLISRVAINMHAATASTTIATPRTRLVESVKLIWLNTVKNNFNNAGQIRVFRN